MKHRPIINLSLIAVAASMPLVGNAVTWDGSDSSLWSDGFNWVGDTAPVAADTLDFSGTAIVNQPSNNDIAAATAFNGITFTNDGSVGVSDAEFTLAGNSITLGGNIVTTVATTGTLLDTIALDLVLDANRNIFAGANHTLLITGNISGAFTAATGNTSFRGRVTFSGNNTHTRTNINRFGNARAETDTALGQQFSIARQSSLSLADGINLTAPNGITAGTGKFAQTIRLDEIGPAAASSIDVGTALNNTQAVAVLALETGVDNTLTANGILSGVGKYQKQGDGTLVLTNAGNDYTGQINVQSGTMEISGSGTLGATTSTLIMGGGNLDLGASTQTIGTLSISGAAASGDTLHNGSLSADAYSATLGAGNAIISANLIDGATPGSNFAKSGNGTVTLSGTNTYTGTTTSSAGSVVATSAAAFPGYTTPGNIIFNGGTIGVQVAGAGWSPAELSDLLTNATKTSGGLGIDTTNGDFTPTAAFTPATLGPLGLTKLGANSLTLDQVNTYTGNTTLTEGTLNINSTTALGDASSTFIIATGTAIDATASAITLANNNPILIYGNVNGPYFTFGGTNDLNLGTGAVTLQLPAAAGASLGTIQLNGSGRTLTFGGDVTSDARGTGQTTMQVEGAGNTLVFGSLGLNQRVAGSNNVWSGSANVTVNGGVLEPVGGSKSFTYAGTGTFTIGGASAYTGDTFVTGGTLALGAGGSLFDETNVTINGGIINLDAAVNDTIKSLKIIGENGDAELDAGTYGSSTSGADNTGIVDPDLYFSGTGIFTIPATDPYAIWAGNALFENDPNFDGISNGLAWILGAANPSDDTARTLLPDGAVSTGDLVMTFTMVDPIAPALLSVEYSNDLTGSWTAAAVPTTAGTVGIVDFVIIDNTGTLSVTATIPASAASAGGELFGRLLATEN